MIQFELNGLRTSVERHNQFIHIRSDYMSAMVPFEEIRFMDTNDEAVKLLQCNSGEIEFMIFVPTDKISDIQEI